MEARAQKSYRWVALALTTMVQVGVSMVQQAPAALGPTLSDDLGLSKAQLGLLSSAIIGGMTITVLAMGVLADRRGERMIVSMGVGVMAVCVLCATQATAFGLLFVLFLLASFGASASTPGGSKAVAAWFPSRQRGVAIGIRQTGLPIGGLLAALLLPPIATRFGWSAGLGLSTLTAFVAVFAFAAFYRPPPTTDVRIRTSLRASLMKLVRNRGVVSLTCCALILVGAQWSAVAYLTVFMHDKLGVSIIVAGAFLAFLQLGGIVGRVGWGFGSDLLGRRKPVLVLVISVAVASCLIMTLVEESTPYPLVGLLVLVLGCSLVGWQGLHITIVSELTSIRAAGTTLGAVLAVSNIGSFVVPPLFGLLIDATGSYEVFWGVLAGWIALGAIFACMFHEPRELDGGIQEGGVSLSMANYRKGEKGYS